MKKCGLAFLLILCLLPVVIRAKETCRLKSAQIRNEQIETSRAYKLASKEYVTNKLIERETSHEAEVSRRQMIGQQAFCQQPFIDFLAELKLADN